MSVEKLDHAETRLRSRPKRHPRLADHAAGFNGNVALGITAVVGTMWTAYIFVLIALSSAPASIGTHDPIIIVGWLSQSLFQLVLLPVILVGQRMQGQAADTRSALTYEDAEAVLKQCLVIEEHLKRQDAAVKP